MGKEFRRRCILQRPAGGFAATGGADPASFHQHVDRAAGNRNPADFLDFRSRHRLVIGDHRQCFDAGAAEFLHRFAAGAQEMAEIGRGLELPFAAAFDEVDAARFVTGGERPQRG